MMPPAAAPAIRALPAAPSRWGLAEFFVVSQTAIPAILFLPSMQGVRLYVRVASFGISIALFAWWAFINTKQSRPHPAQTWVVVTVIYIAAMVLHPFTSSTVGGIAQLVLYASVMAPLLWAPAVVRDADHLARLMTLLLICNGVNAFVGVMQVYDPDRWMPQEMSRIVTESAFGLDTVSYMGPTGRIIRPPGLFDNPGAVAGPGMYAALLGLAFTTSALAWWRRAAALGASFAGVAAIYLSQVRVSLVVLAVMMGAYVAVLTMHKRMQRATVFGGIAGGLIVATYAFAVMLGGDSIVDRTMTLFAQDPVSLYSASRGGQLVYTFDDLVVTYPFGAGLGRWGMIATYFAGSQRPLWAEIQISGWAIDGGIPLILIGMAAPLIALFSLWRLALSDPNAKVRACAAVIFAANLGTAALVFSFTPFVTQIGLQFWFLAGAAQGIATRTAIAGPRR